MKCHKMWHFFRDYTVCDSICLGFACVYRAKNHVFTENSEEETIEDKPRILWSLYFTQKDNSFINSCDKLPDNVFLLSGPGTEVDIDRPVQEVTK